MRNPKRNPEPFEWHEDPEFLKLRKQWYKKLEDEGFDDIEITDWESGESGNLLRGFGHMDAVRQGIDRFEARRDYFALCSWMVHRLEECGVPELECLRTCRRPPTDEEVLEIFREHAAGEYTNQLSKKYGFTEKLLTKILRELYAIARQWDAEEV